MEIIIRALDIAYFSAPALLLAGTFGVIIVVARIACDKIASIKSSKKDKAGDSYAYERKGNLLSNAELSFYRSLKTACDTNLCIFPKVRIADVVSVEKGLDRKTWAKSFNKIARKHNDFVVCDSETSEILCVIELDDKSHNTEKSIRRDAFVDKAMASAGLPIWRVTAKSHYSVSELSEKMQELTNTKGTAEK